MAASRRHRAKPVLGMIGLAFVALLGACGSDDDKAATGTTTSSTSGGTTTSKASGAATASTAGGSATDDPCALLTLKQVTDAFGAAPGSPFRDSQACTWTVGSDRPQIGSGKPYIRVSFEEDYQYSFYEDKGTSVSGIGDAAFDYDGTLYFREGDKYFSIYLGAMSDDAREQLARYVLEHA